MAIAKKTSTSQPSNKSAPPSHPPYLQMISEAIAALKDRTGSSQQAISKFIEDQYEPTLPPNFKKMLSVQLKKFVKSEKLLKVKNSYKISDLQKVKMVAEAVREAEKNRDPKITTKRVSNKKETAKKAVDKAMKTKRLSQVKTPDALKKKKESSKKGVKNPSSVGKREKVSQVNSPVGLKKKKLSTPDKKKQAPASKPAAKKAK